MARPKNAAPVIRHHKSTNTARCWVDGKWVRLGRWGTPEAKEAHARLCADLARSPGVNPGRTTETPVHSIDAVLLGFWRYAEQHYRRPDGTTTNELNEYRQTFGPLRELYGSTSAAGFGPLALKNVRQRMIDRGWCRTLINRRVGRIRRVFKWATSEELVPAAVHQALVTLTGLMKGRTAARERPPVRPVAEEHARAVFPFVRPQVRGMIELQLYSCCRPAEAARIRPCDLETSGSIWVYRPPHQKSAHREKPRVIAIGPRAQRVLAEFTPSDPTDYYFSPQAAVAQFHAERTQVRKTPKYPSHIAHNAARRVKSPGQKHRPYYTTTAYEKAIRRGVVRANRALIEAAVEIELHVPHWAPHRLRHTSATAVRKRFGLEAAQVALGHERADVTQTYAERNMKLAAEVAAAVG